VNKRIQELVKQTDIWCDQNVAQDSPMYNNQWENKFAELIIQECANYIRENYDSWDAEPLAHNLEVDFGLHGDYAE
jgi:hypothetical protein